MASIGYEEIFEDFLGRITDYELMRLDDDEAYERMSEWLEKFTRHPYVRRLFSSLSRDRDEQVINYTLKNITTEDEDKDFVLTMFSNGMVCEWVEPLMNRTSTLVQMFATKEQKMYSQASHLAELKTLYENSRREVRGLIRDRGFIYNEYLGGA